VIVLQKVKKLEPLFASNSCLSHRMPISMATAHASQSGLFLYVTSDGWKRWGNLFTCVCPWRNPGLLLKVQGWFSTKSIVCTFSDQTTQSHQMTYILAIWSIYRRSRKLFPRIPEHFLLGEVYSTMQSIHGWPSDRLTSPVTWRCKLPDSQVKAVTGQLLQVDTW
jgi:hypothetical protein